MNRAAERWAMNASRRLPQGRHAAREVMRSQAWRQVALARHLSRRAVRRARIESLVLLGLLAGIFLVYEYRHLLFPASWDPAVRGVAALALVSLGWQFARDVGRAVGPTLFRRMDPGAAGTFGFLIRLITMCIAVVIALRVAGIRPRTLLLGGAATAVVFGLAAQQTLGNVMAGTVLLNARTFRVGERIRLQGGGLAGSVEGIVSSLGLMYTTLANGADTIMVPNSVVLSVAVVPLREPAAVSLRARLRPGSTPMEIEEHLRAAISTPIRGAPSVTLEEVDEDEVVVRIAATPSNPGAGPRLATEVLHAIAPHVARSGNGDRAAPGNGDRPRPTQPASGESVSSSR